MPSWPTCHIMISCSVGWYLWIFFPPGNPSEPLTWTTPRAVGAAKWVDSHVIQQNPPVGVQRTTGWSVEVVTDVVRLAEAWDNEMRISETASATASQIRRQELHQARSAAMHQTRMEAISSSRKPMDSMEEENMRSWSVKMISKSQTPC